MGYATVNDYLSWAGGTVAPTGLARLLEVASVRVDEMLVGVVYDVDARGKPTDLETADVLRRATVEQVLYMLDTGDESGTGGGVVTEQTIGRVAWKTGGGSSGSGATVRRHAPEAVALLHVEGLVPVNPYRN